MLLGIIVFGSSAVIALKAQNFQKKSVVAAGVVSGLRAGPLHSTIEVEPKNAPKFSYLENSSRSPLTVGQHILVRYDPADPEDSARVDSVWEYQDAFEVAVTGVGMILLAAITPWLVRTFPGLVTTPVRP